MTHSGLFSPREIALAVVLEFQRLSSEYEKRGDRDRAAVAAIEAKGAQAVYDALAQDEHIDAGD